MHQSRCATSSCCCLPSSSTILSISAFTFVKASSWALAANNANCGSPLKAAPRRSASAARLTSSSSAAEFRDATCRNAVFTVRAKLSKDLSSFKIWMVSSTAAISAVRSLTRCSNSASVCAQRSFKFARKVRSNSNCAWVSSSSLNAWACFSFKSAISWSNSACNFRPVAISSCFAACSDANSTASFFSLPWALAKSFSKSSFICSSTPKICPLRGA
mmetsp:Transcript_126330/g.363391  ORF Transcript_126330/g.363391 Transcript_126330/m.363391 type:complete len:217 (-) Transcript_126330:223-873(-)